MNSRQLLDSVSKIDHTKPQWANTGVVYAYHRTFNIDHIYSIKYDKYRPGKDSLYGAGFYATYTLAAQDKHRMRRFYGNYIVRLKIDLSNYLILDAPLIRKLRRRSVYHQLAAKRINLQGIENFIGNKFIADYLNNDKANSSYRLKNLIAIAKDLPDKFSGVMFTGDTDGPVVLAYDLSTVQVIDYAIFGRQHNINNLIWYKFNKKYARDVSGNNFVDRIMAKAMRLKINSAMLYLQKMIGELSRRERRFFLYYLAGKRYRTIGQNKNPVIDWLINPISDKFFAELFADVLASPPLPKFKHYQLVTTKPPPCFLLYLADQQDLIKNSFTLRLFSKVGRIKLDEFRQDWHSNLDKFFNQKLLQPGTKLGLKFQLRQMVNLVTDYLLLSYKLFPTISQESIIQQMQLWLLDNPELPKLDKKWRSIFLVALRTAITMGQAPG